MRQLIGHIPPEMMTNDEIIEEGRAVLELHGREPRQGDHAEQCNSPRIEYSPQPAEFTRGYAVGQQNNRGHDNPAETFGKHGERQHGMKSKQPTASSLPQ